jgi:hypothetical protein
MVQVLGILALFLISTSAHADEPLPMPSFSYFAEPTPAAKPTAELAVGDRLDFSLVGGAGAARIEHAEAHGYREVNGHGFTGYSVTYRLAGQGFCRLDMEVADDSPYRDGTPQARAFDALVGEAVSGGDAIATAFFRHQDVSSPLFESLTEMLGPGSRQMAVTEAITVPGATAGDARRIVKLESHPFLGGTFTVDCALPATQRGSVSDLRGVLQGFADLETRDGINYQDLGPQVSDGDDGRQQVIHLPGFVVEGHASGAH